jgi:hypothetical protein
MGMPRGKEPVVRVAALLSPAGDDPGRLLESLEALWGPLARVSEPVDFRFTRFYEREMGPGLARRFAAFANPAPADSLREWKTAGNALEAEYAVRGSRRANVDPGYLDLNAVVVASVKDAAYRVYLGRGIYAQPMLRFEAGSFRAWPWTYPDYATPSAIGFFNAVRAGYRDAVRRTGNGAPHGCGGAVSLPPVSSPGCTPPDSARDRRDGIPSRGEGR